MGCSWVRILALIYSEIEAIKNRIAGPYLGTRWSFDLAPERGWFVRISSQIRTNWVASLEGEVEWDDL